jgi:hypothetical protein
MKRCFIILLLAMLLGVLFCACSANPPVFTTESADTSSNTESHSPVSSFGESISEAASPPPPVSESSRPVSSENTATPESYTMHLLAAVQIFSEPSYDGKFVQAIGLDGVYTIVEESVDTDGSYWGKLKSGAGWINLKYTKRV